MWVDPTLPSHSSSSLCSGAGCGKRCLDGPNDRATGNGQRATSRSVDLKAGRRDFAQELSHFAVATSLGVVATAQQVAFWVGSN